MYIFPHYAVSVSSNRVGGIEGAGGNENVRSSECAGFDAREI